MAELKDSGAERLAAGVVKRAIDDYKSNLKAIAADPGDRAAISRNRALIKWFRSPDFAFWTSADPDYILRMIAKDGDGTKKAQGAITE